MTRNEEELNHIKVGGKNLERKNSINYSNLRMTQTTGRMPPSELEASRKSMLPITKSQRCQSIIKLSPTNYNAQKSLHSQQRESMGVDPQKQQGQ
mmetsp:Transcript_5536/g.9445  ORF Transcript_5536/g.9445 Transcript_5536/m.9445 type:complete len:95 (+) Transcript_5536:1569-1853(+)